MKIIYLLIAVLHFSTSFVKSDFFELCQKVQQYEISYRGKCTLNEYSLSSALNETFQFIIFESDPSKNLDSYLRDELFVGTADYFKALYFPKFEEQLKNLVKELLSVADNAKNSVSGITLEYLFTSHIRSGFDKAIDAIQKLNQDTLNAAAVLLNNGNITNEEFFVIKQNQTCNTGSYCNEIETWFGLENLDQVKNLPLTTFLKQTNDRFFRKFAKPEYTSSKVLIDKFIGNLDSQGTNGVKLADLIEILKTEYMTEIIYSFDSTYTTKRATRTSTIKATRTTTTKKPKVDESLIAVETGVLVGVPLGVLGLGFICTILGIYFWYNFVPIRSHQPTKINDIESKLPDNMYEMNVPPQFQNKSKYNNVNTISLNNYNLHNKF